jgi:hypothetical protein
MRHAAFALAFAHCASPVSLLSSRAGVATVSAEISTRVSGGADPLPVRGAGFEFVDIERALARAMSEAAFATGGLWKAMPGQSKQLLVELVADDAWQHGGDLGFWLAVRVTLKRDGGQARQTHLTCEATSGKPGEVAEVCLTQLGRDLKQWFETLAKE